MCLGVPGRIVEVDAATGLSMGIVDFDGVRRPVCLAYTPEAAVGDRQDDGVGLVVAEQIQRSDLPDVRVVTTDGELSRMIEAWSGADIAVVVDAVRLADPTPGRVHRMLVGDLPGHVSSASSHGLGVPEAVELARVLDRLPGRLVLYTVEVQATGFGVGLSDPVATAVPDLVDAVLRELAGPPSSPPREST